MDSPPPSRPVSHRLKPKPSRVIKLARPPSSPGDLCQIYLDGEAGLWPRVLHLMLDGLRNVQDPRAQDRVHGRRLLRHRARRIRLVSPDALGDIQATVNLRQRQHTQRLHRVSDAPHREEECAAW